MLKHNTKHILANSFEDLLNTRSFESITVKEIVENCNASRTAFYNHFEDKYDLMAWIYKSNVDELLKGRMETTEFRDIAFDICKFVYEKREYFNKIIEYKGQNSITDFLCNYGNTNMSLLLKKELGLENLPKELLYSIKIWSTGASALMLEWIKFGTNESPEELSSILCDNIPMPLTKYLK